MDNFYCTARRMWNDVNILYRSGNSYFNTCYLAGYILECYGKILVLTYDATSNVKDYSHNLTRLNGKVTRDIIFTTTLSKYCLDLSSECNTIYSGVNKWNPLKRYEDDPNLWCSKEIADNYINESKKIIEILDEMKLDGVI